MAILLNEQNFIACILLKYSYKHHNIKINTRKEIMILYKFEKVKITIRNITTTILEQKTVKL